ncbi:hypothetical protein WDU94_000162 [Cyamophila willieti]
MDDPIIEYVQSGRQPGSGFKGTPAGGTHINVIGKNFGYIENTSMYIVYEGKRYVSRCHITSDEHMQCTAPIITRYVKPNTTKLLWEELEYGFEMYNGTSVLNLASKLNNFYELYPNPIYKPFFKEKVYKLNEYLTISGEYLNLAFDESDIIVKIGTDFCNVEAVSRHQLICMPPARLPPRKLLTVTVSVGNNLIFNIGELIVQSQTESQKYTQADNHEKEFLLLAALKIAIMTIFVLILTTMLYAYRRNP